MESIHWGLNGGNIDKVWSRCGNGIAERPQRRNEKGAKKDPINEPYNVGDDYNSDTDEDSKYDEEEELTSSFSARGNQSHELALNSRKARIYGLQKTGIQNIPEHVWCHQKSDFREMEMLIFVKDVQSAMINA